MIGTFWNICRACPSMPVDKLHSEYRSTYHWHEYKSAKHEVIEKPPQSNFGGSEIEPQLPRRKKNPAYAYRTHSILKSPNNTSRTTSTSLDRARCSERETDGSSRRSKSEGPHSASSTAQYRLLRSDSYPSDFANQAMNGDDKSSTKNTKDVGKISTEYRLQFAWPLSCNKVEEEGLTPGAKKSRSMGALKASQQPSLVSNIQPTPIHKKENIDPKKHSTIVQDTMSQPLLNGDISDSSKHQDIDPEQHKQEYVKPIFSWSEFNTEYKKKFRPFSQYDYIEGVFKPKMESEIIPQELSGNETWFREVLELRKKAGEYKHRGWGTELVPEHIAQLYNKQISLWEHVARRSSLEALSLDSAHPKKVSKEENELAYKKAFPSRALWVELEGGKNELNRTRLDNFLRYNFVDRGGFTSGRTHVAGPDQRSEFKSPKKATRLPSQQRQTGVSSSDKIDKSQRPTCLPTALSEAKPLGISSKENEPRSKQAVLKNRLNEMSPTNSLVISSKRYKSSSSAICGPDVFKNIVKSPPEPTRVKSPEQITLRSPEPVNWTVPLDTGKTFTVTQNVSQEPVA